jgi:hypothetical protein
LTSPRTFDHFIAFAGGHNDIAEICESACNNDPPLGPIGIQH